MRLTPSGALDTTFGTGGSVVDTANPGSYLTGVVVDSSHRIVTIGTDGVVRRYTATGTPDSSFGTSGHTGALIAPGGFGTGTNALGLQPADGKILVAGTSSGGVGTVIRLNSSDGSLDTTFGTAGTATLASGTAIRQMTLEGTGIVVGGSDASGNGMLARLTSTGTLDTTFGIASGYDTFTAPSGYSEHVDALFYDPGNPAGLIFCLYQSSNSSNNKTGGCSTLGVDGQTPGTPIPIQGTPKNGGYSFTPNSWLVWLSYFGLSRATTEPGTGTAGGDGAGTGTGTGTGSTTETQPRQPDFRLRITKLSRYVGTEESGVYIKSENIGEVPTPYVGHIDAVFTITNDGTAPGAATVAAEAAATTGDLLGGSYGLGATGGVTDLYQSQSYHANASNNGIRSASVSVIGGDPACTGGRVFLLPGFSVTKHCSYRLTQKPKTVLVYFDAEVTPFDNPGVDNDTYSDNKAPTVTIHVLQGPASEEDRIPHTVTPDRLSEFSGEGNVNPAALKTALDARANSPSAITRVYIALLRVAHGAKAARAGAARAAGACLWLKNARAQFVRRPARLGLCQDQLWLTASGTTRWIYRLAGHLPPGRYVLYSRATDRAGITDELFSDQLHNRQAFTVR